MRKLTELEKAYLAGFFDGEGCISISKWQGKNNRTPVYSLQVVLVQKQGKLLFEFQDKTGIGSVHQRQKYQPGTFEWRISPIEGVKFLKSLLPYLRIKKEEALIAIEFSDRHNRKSLKGRGYIVPQEAVEDKEKYYRSLQNLKGTSGKQGKRGRPKS